MKRIRIEKYKKGQETQIYQLIKKIYDEFVAIDYSEAGNQFFYNWIDPVKIAERQQNQINLWVAFHLTRLVGMIEIRENNFVSLLFVDKEFHGQGVAKRMFHESVKECLRKDPKLTTFNVHASPFSIPVYEKLGFVGTGEMEEQFGIKYLPMELNLN